MTCKRPTEDSPAPSQKRSKESKSVKSTTKKASTVDSHPMTMVPLLISRLGDDWSASELIIKQLERALDAKNQEFPLIKNNSYLYENSLEENKNTKQTYNQALIYTIKRLVRGLASTKPTVSQNYMELLRVLSADFSQHFPKASQIYGIMIRLLSFEEVGGRDALSAGEFDALMMARLLMIDLLLESVDDDSNDLCREKLLKCLQQVWRGCREEGEGGLVAIKAIDVIVQASKLKILNNIHDFLSISNEEKESSLKMTCLRLALVDIEGLFSDDESGGGKIAMKMLKSIDLDKLGHPLVSFFIKAFFQSICLNHPQSEQGLFREAWSFLMDLFSVRKALLKPTIHSLTHELWELIHHSADILSIIVMHPVFIELACSLPSSSKEGDGGDNIPEIVRDLLSSENHPDLQREFICACIQEHPNSFADVFALLIPRLSADKLADILSKIEGDGAEHRLVPIKLVEVYSCFIHGDGEIPDASLKKDGLPSAISENHQRIIKCLFAIKFRWLGCEETSRRISSSLTRIHKHSSTKEEEEDNEDSTKLMLLIKYCLEECIRPMIEIDLCELDAPTRDAYEQACDLLSTNKENSGGSLSQLLQKLVLVSSVLLFLEPLSVVSVFDDISAMISGECTDDEEHCKFTLDILLVWASQQSSLLRLCADELFAEIAFNGHGINQEMLDSLKAVLLTQPGNEDSLMEGEEAAYDEEQDESDDTSDDDSMSTSSHSTDNSQSKNSSTKGSELSVIELKNANDSDLQALDKQLSNIMRARKQQEISQKMSRTTLVHFKQKVLDWFVILCSGDDTKANRRLIKADLVMTFMSLFKMHLDDQEFFSKTAAIFNDLYVLENTSSAGEDDKNPSEKFIECLDDLLEAMQRMDKLETTLAIKAFWWIAANGAIGEDRLGLSLGSIWSFYIKNTHALHLKHLFDAIKIKYPSMMLSVISKYLAAINSCRKYFRDQVMQFTLSIFRKKVQLHEKECKKFFKKISKNIFTISTDAFAKSGELKEHMALLSSFISKSKHFCSSDLASEIWSPAIESLHLLLASKKDIWQSNQHKSFIDRLSSIQAMLKKK